MGIFVSFEIEEYVGDAGGFGVGIRLYVAEWDALTAHFGDEAFPLT